MRTTGERAEDTDRFGSIGCLWGSSARPPGGAPLVRLVTAEGIDYYREARDRARETVRAMVSTLRAQLGR